MPLGTGPYSNHYKSAANFAMPSSLDAADALTCNINQSRYKYLQAVLQAI